MSKQIVIMYFIVVILVIQLSSYRVIQLFSLTYELNN
jgi:hypothetical protein